jgi:succinyl-diaminopimelate desuccinylase
MDYVQVLKDLISIDTTVPPGLNYARAMDYLEPLFRELGFETVRIHIPGKHAEGNEGRVNLIAHRRAQGQPRLFFYGHIDVVPAEGWDAFNPRVVNGKVYGRGAADMKGAIVALLLGLEKLRERPLKYDVSVMITTDEETNQANQIRYLRQFLEPVSGGSVFNLDSDFGYVGVTGLGAIQMDVTVKGKSVHSALEHLGENAVEKANLLLTALLDLKGKVVQRKSEVAASPDTGLTRMEAKLNVNMVKGGLKVNIVPDKCTLSIDRRLIPEENLEEAEREIVETLFKVQGVEYEIENVFRIPPVPPCSGPLVDRLENIIREVTGQTGKFGTMGSGELSYIVNSEWGVKEFSLGVIRSDCQIHGKDEFVYRKDIEDLAEIIRRFLS